MNRIVFFTIMFASCVPVDQEKLQGNRMLQKPPEINHEEMVRVEITNCVSGISDTIQVPSEDVARLQIFNHRRAVPELMLTPKPFTRGKRLALNVCQYKILK